MCGMKKAQLSRYEVGTSKPRPEVLHRIAAALGVSPRWLEDANESVNEHEVPEEFSKTVPVSPELMEKLLQIATLRGVTLSKAMEMIVDSAISELKKNAAKDADAGNGPKTSRKS
jgi:transcriptional regulator with XRE-family HTH domain